MTDWALAVSQNVGSNAKMYRNISEWQDDYAETPTEFPLSFGELRGASKSLLNGMHKTIFSLSYLGIFADGSNDLLSAVYRAIMVDYTILTLYNVWIAWTNAQSIKEVALASGLSAIPALWPFIPAALITSAVVVGTFAGFEFGSGEWQFPNIDISKPHERRAIGRSLSTVVG